MTRLLDFWELIPDSEKQNGVATKAKNIYLSLTKSYPFIFWNPNIPSIIIALGGLAISLKINILLLGSTYHIYNHANGSDNIFREDKNYPFFLAKYQHHISSIAEMYGYCLLKNHFHLLVRIKSEEEIIEGLKDRPGFLQNLDGLNGPDRYYFLQRTVSQQFSNFFNGYTKAFNKVYNRMGSLFMKNFKFKPILSDSQIVTTLIYIHLNPVKHGFTTEFDSWPWSSYNLYFAHSTSFYSFHIIEQLFANKLEFKFMHTHRQLQILGLNEEF